MPLLSLKLPPGMAKNGTTYLQKGRWVDGDMVRWLEGVAQPIGGWQRLVNLTTQVNTPPLYPDPSIEAARNVISWRDVNGNIITVVGTNDKLYAIDEDNVITDITPAGFTGGGKDGGGGLRGYSVGPYGAESYGTARVNISQTSIQLFSWSFAIWGYDLIATGRGDLQPVYTWTPGTAQASALANAPDSSRGLAVSGQRILITVGDNANNRLVSWSDSEDNTLWAPDITNQAGSQTLDGSGIFATIVNVGRVLLLISETDAYIMRYIGPPYIFGFERVGENTLIISANAIAVVSDIAFWWGFRSFWAFDGNTISPVPCDVMDFIAEDKDPNMNGKISAHPNARYNEIWWHYQSKNSTTTEPDSYVAFNYVERFWFTGRLDRTSGADGSSFTKPVMVSSDGVVYNHELPSVLPDNPNYLVSGPIEVGNGDQVLYADYIYPDIHKHGTEGKRDTEMFLIGQDFPNDIEITYGPYTIDKPTAIRARGRQFSLRIEGKSDLWEQGDTRINVLPGGVR